MNVSDAIRTKRATRLFTEQPLPDEVTRAILHAGRRAQSSKNTQPWNFIAVQNRATLKALAECGTYASHLAGAALGVVIASVDPAQRWSIMFDCGQSAAYMQLAAWELGVGSCLATIYEPDKARALLSVPAEWHLNVAISFGYPAPNQQLPAIIRNPGRRAISVVVHWEHW